MRINRKQRRERGPGWYLRAPEMTHSQEHSVSKPAQRNSETYTKLSMHLRTHIGVLHLHLEIILKALMIVFMPAFKPLV